jgi:CBS domain-containing protein
MRTIGELVPEGSPSSDTMDWLARLLWSEGVNLLEVSDRGLERGTPVYVEASADAIEVQRRMAQLHIRRLPVVGEDTLVGIVDILDLADRLTTNQPF